MGPVPGARYDGTSERLRIRAIVRDRSGAVASVCRLDRRFSGAFVSGP